MPIGILLSKFQPTPPVGAETLVSPRSQRPPSNFNPLRPWGRRLAIAQGLLNAVIFQPTPPVGAETQTKITITEDKLFQPTPPVGAETRRFRPSNTRNDISTHSARGGGDHREEMLSYKVHIFQPTPPVGAETIRTSQHVNELVPISTHSARGGGDRAVRSRNTLDKNISTHSARGGGDIV